MLPTSGTSTPKSVFHCLKQRNFKGKLDEEKVKVKAAVLLNCFKANIYEKFELSIEEFSIVKYSVNNKYVVVGNENYELNCYDLKLSQVFWKYTNPLPLQIKQIETTNDKVIVKWNDEIDDQGIISIFNIATGVLEHEIAGAHIKDFSKMIINSNKIFVNLDKNVGIWSLKGKQISEINLNLNPTECSFIERKISSCYSNSERPNILVKSLIETPFFFNETVVFFKTETESYLHIFAKFLNPTKYRMLNLEKLNDESSSDCIVCVKNQSLYIGTSLGQLYEFNYIQSNGMKLIGKETTEIVSLKVSEDFLLCKAGSEDTLNLWHLPTSEKISSTHIPKEAQDISVIDQQLTYLYSNKLNILSFS